MKKVLMFSFIALLLFTTVGYGQAPPPPPGSGHGQSGNQTGGNAPIGSGTIILLMLGAAYGGKKVYHYFKDEEA